MCEIGASSWFYDKEICYDARSHERKKNASEKFRNTTKNSIQFNLCSVRVITFCVIGTTRNNKNLLTKADSLF